MGACLIHGLSSSSSAGCVLDEKPAPGMPESKSPRRSICISKRFDRDPVKLVDVFGQMRDKDLMATRQAAQKRKRLKEKFLAEYAKCGNVSAACRVVGVSRYAVAEWYRADEEFRRGHDNATEVACDALEEAARTRAVDGVAEPVYHMGQVCGEVQRYSDTLLIFLLKGARPQKYRESLYWQQQVNAAGDVNVGAGGAINLILDDDGTHGPAGRDGA